MQARIIYAITVTSVIVAIFVAVCLSLHYLNVPKEQEWPNNVTLVAEIVVGFIIAVIVFAQSYRTGLVHDKKISDVFDIVSEKEKNKIKNQTILLTSILTGLQKIHDTTITILEKINNYNSSSITTEKHLLQKQVKYYADQLEALAEKYLNVSDPDLAESFSTTTLGVIKTISSMCQNQPEIGDKIDDLFYSNLKNTVQPMVNELEILLKARPQDKPKQLDLQFNGTGISTSVDRTVYPVDSVIHMRVWLKNIVKDQEILFELFNSDRELLISQSLIPSKSVKIELARENIFQADFKMEGSVWEVGNQYIARGTYGMVFAEDSFTIDQHTPIIQTDKSVYLLNDDIIITVIDPDANKDNEKVEYVGNDGSSKLTIQTNHGSIDGYVLKETGPLTGIFQGIVGILRIRNDGVIMPREFDGKIIRDIQETAIDDGFIAAQLGDEIIITYESKNDTDFLSVYVSDFGAAVELDQKIYSPTDKVYIKIIAPDLISDHTRINEIGQDDNSSILIVTGSGKLPNYKLVETGIDTGIFFGEVQLAKKSKKNNLGPTDGIIACEEEDFIEVVLRYHDREYFARGTIKNQPHMQRIGK